MVLSIARIGVLLKLFGYTKKPCAEGAHVLRRTRIAQRGQKQGVV